MRITSLPISERLRDLRQTNLNNFVSVSGVVTRRTGVYPQLTSVAYDCIDCGHTAGPFLTDGGGGGGGSEMRPSMCGSCSSKKGFKLNPHKTVYGNYQRLTLQESPGTVPPGRVPRNKDVILLGDLIDIARPGEEINVTGIYMHSQIGGRVSKEKTGFPVYSTVIEANSVQKLNAESDARLTDEDKRQIRELSKDPKVSTSYR